jgi:hypothetical protein
MQHVYHAIVKAESMFLALPCRQRQNLPDSALKTQEVDLLSIAYIFLAV